MPENRTDHCSTSPPTPLRLIAYANMEFIHGRGKVADGWEGVPRVRSLSHCGQVLLLGGIRREVKLCAAEISRQFKDIIRFRFLISHFATTFLFKIILKIHILTFFYLFFHLILVILVKEAYYQGLF